jgi:hypothetical protein
MKYGHLNCIITLFLTSLFVVYLDEVLWKVRSLNMDGLKINFISYTYNLCIRSKYIYNWVSQVK